MKLFLLACLLPGIIAACTPNTTDTNGLQLLLQEGGAGAILSLCQGQTYNLTQTLNFAAQYQVRPATVPFFQH